MDLASYQRLKDRAERLQRESAKAEGQLEQLTKQLKEEFGVKDVKAAEALLTKLQTELADLESDFETEMAAFEKQYGPLMGGRNG